MKKFIFMGLASLVAFTSCQKVSMDSESEEDGFANLTFDLTPVGSNETFSLTRAGLSSTISKLDLVVYSVDGTDYTEFKTIQQESSDESFGNVSIENVPYGEYLVIAVGHKCSNHATITPTKVDFDGKLADTFMAYKTITVSSKTSAQSLELNRVTSQFILLVEDLQPEEIKSVEFKVTGGATEFDPSTGLAAAASEDERTVTISDVSSFSGQTERTFSFRTCLPSIEATINVVANFKNADGETVCSKTFDDVPMKVNRMTKYSGKIYNQLTSTGGISFSISDTQEEEYTYSF